MAAGFGFIAFQTVGEVGYYKYAKKNRDEEIKDEKDNNKKMIKFQSMT